MAHSHGGVGWALWDLPARPGEWGAELPYLFCWPPPLALAWTRAGELRQRSGKTHHSSEPNPATSGPSEHSCSANAPSRPSLRTHNPMSSPFSFPPVPDIEFNVTGNYGSPMHVNHNANYSSMPSPDMDHADRRQHDQARRPLSVATDNMMLEFYKKDG